MEEQDDSSYEEIQSLYQALAAYYEEQKLLTLLSGEYDGKNAILTFHAGAGGTRNLKTGYRCCYGCIPAGQRHGFKVKILDILDGEEAGVKSASVLVEGMNAYGYLKSETGGSSIGRVSPFDASGRRHASLPRWRLCRK